ncbi:MAG: hypothetical protein PHV37_01875 [Candidatus Gastranaerophilales bacterium]|nr:hypothetical protein [Candidatus Gastranaerophilales bacterium]
MTRFEDISIDNVQIVAESIEKEIERRRIQLWFYRFLYYKFDDPKVTDYEYDKKEYEYKLLRQHYRKIKVNGACPLKKVGTDTDKATEWKVLQLINSCKRDKKEPDAVASFGQLKLF